ncbi:hypothetical protein [Parafrankia elaeagni]|uniref:hypothetical protein n=1 Tax=Parafrankia elaeagni TaxID=222534 RepID=UPI00037E7621|nr:hypothetical protein [Parafrankia elaeagni]
MNPAALAVTCFFPLIGRPRLACPALPARVTEIAEIAQTAARDGADGLAEGAHALNKAALLASDCGLALLARDLCWQHINIYRAAPRPLTILQARYMLEPVVNLARLQIRASDGQQALDLLTSMFQAVSSNTDLIIDGQVLPLANLTGTCDERHKLREWVWLHLVGDGVRALALAGRWDDAVNHADTHRGIGLHLLEGRQAKILAHCLNGTSAAARAALAESTPTNPWEFQVASCLEAMCTEGAPTGRSIATMIGYFRGQRPVPGYTVFRAHLGMTVAALATATDRDAAVRVFAQVVNEVIEAEDGYAARDVLRFHHTHAVELPAAKGKALADLLGASGLRAGPPPEPVLDAILSAARTAEAAIAASIHP